MSNQALAFVSGALLLRSSTPIALPNDVRKTLKRILKKFEDNSEGRISIWHRWLLMNVDTVEAGHLWSEAGGQWLRKPRTSFSELTSFLDGFFTLWPDTVFRTDALTTLVSEIERVEKDLPVRFQELFFELSTILTEYEHPEVDLEVIKDARQINSSTLGGLTESMLRSGTKKEEKSSPATPSRNTESQTTPSDEKDDSHESEEASDTMAAQEDTRTECAEEHPNKDTYEDVKVPP